MASGLTTWALLAATAGLLAFLVGAYTLVGRDRKSPYLINSVFAVFLICLVGAAVDVAAAISPWCRGSLLVAGAATLLLAILVSIWRLWTIYVRLAYFVDPGSVARLKHLPGIRQFLSWRKDSSGRRYEHSPVPLGSDLQDEIVEIIAARAKRDGLQQHSCLVEVRDRNDPRALALALKHLGQANDVIGSLAAAFLSRPNHYVQYMTASRHPVEFIEHLRATWLEKPFKWEEVRERIVAVDAYTPHFGFIDTIYKAKSARVDADLGTQLLSANETYAGLHSAASKAFKIIKRQSGKPSMRQPTLVIYEDMYSLVDLESVEQYRIFVRHVLPSERLWDGMFSVFAETAQREEDWKLVSSYASMTLDLRSEVREAQVAGGADA